MLSKTFRLMITWTWLAFARVTEQFQNENQGESPIVGRNPPPYQGIRISNETRVFPQVRYSIKRVTNISFMGNQNGSDKAHVCSNF